jgi:cell division protein FtsB
MENGNVVSFSVFLSSFSAIHFLYNKNMKIAAAIILSIAFIFVATQIVAGIREERSLAQTFSDVSARLEQAKVQEQDLSAEMSYLSNPANLEKELRARFNYAKPGETMVVIVPSSTATSSASGE